MEFWPAILWTLPWILIAAGILYAGYLAYQADLARKAAAAAPKPTGPDPIREMERINTEMARLATQSRQTLESARESMRKGLRG